MALFERGCAEACILPGGCGWETYEPFFCRALSTGLSSICHYLAASVLKSAVGAALSAG